VQHASDTIGDGKLLGADLKEVNARLADPAAIIRAHSSEFDESITSIQQTKVKPPAGIEPGPADFESVGVRITPWRRFSLRFNLPNNLPRP
jgi:hypothetical protein